MNRQVNQSSHSLGSTQYRALAGLIVFLGALLFGCGLIWPEYRAKAAPSDIAKPAATDEKEATGVSQDRARQAVTDGEIMALHEILTHIDRRYQGRVLEVILKDQEAGLHGWVYDIRLLVVGPRVLHLRVDAGTGSILMVEGDKEMEKP